MLVYQPLCWCSTYDWILGNSDWDDFIYFEISNAGGNIDMKLLSDGVSTTHMTTTVTGLIVGIVGYITYNHLVVKTNKRVVYQMEEPPLLPFRFIKRTSCIDEFALAK